MKKGADIGEAIVAYLKKIHPRSATKAEIFSGIGVSGCAGESWLETVVAGREVKISGKKGNYNLYQYSGP